MKLKTSKDDDEPREDSFLLQKEVRKSVRKTKPKKVLDVGTGTSIQAITAKLAGAEEVTAVDINKKALDLAKSNAELNDIEIKVVKSNLFSNISGKFDLIIFNAPYLPIEPPKNPQWSGGRKLIEKFLKDARKHLSPKGRILFVYSSLSPIKSKHRVLAKEKFPDNEEIYVAEVTY